MSVPKHRKRSLPLKVSKEIDELKEPFRALAYPPSRKDFAVRFVSTFNRWSAHYSKFREFRTYAEFIRIIDPSLPERQYHSHRAYQVADDFRKLVTRTGSRRPKDEI